MSTSTGNLNGALARLAVLGALAPAAAHAAPVEFEGHFYEVIVRDGITWNSANALAEGMSHGGVLGHLATITSAEEDAFLHALRSGLYNGGNGALRRPEVWVGGSQPPGSAEPGSGWTWVNDEGPIPGVNSISPYANWLGGEPNNLPQGGAYENHLAIGLGNAQAWNDEGGLNNIGGYIVEYDVETVLDATDCVSGGSDPGCNPTGGQNLVLPPNVQLQPNATIGFKTFEFTDDPARCRLRIAGGRPLVLFGSDTDPANEMPDLIIPPYLCGSPKFVVVATETDGVNIFNGVVQIENDTRTLLPDNLYDCDAPIPQNFPTVGDPQHQDVVVWQSTNRADMLEDRYGFGIFGGAAGEFTNGCGSSRGASRGASYFVIGMHIEFGPGFAWASNTAANHVAFIALTRYKLVLTRIAVERAYADKALKVGDYQKLHQQVEAAITQLDRLNHATALVHVRNFLRFVDQATYKTVPGKNHNGEHLMRGRNVEFMLTTKVIPYGFRR